MEIVEDKQNKLLKRRELKIKMQSTGSTPSRQEIKKQIAKKLKVDEGLVIVNHLGSAFGSSDIKIRAKIYDTEESLKTNARPHMVKRNTAESKAEEGEA